MARGITPVPKSPVALVGPVLIQQILPLGFARGCPSAIASAWASFSLWLASVFSVIGLARVEARGRHSSRAAGATPGEAGGDDPADAPVMLDEDDPADDPVIPDVVDPVIPGVNPLMIPNADAPMILDADAPMIPDVDDSIPGEEYSVLGDGLPAPGKDAPAPVDDAPADMDTSSSPKRLIAYYCDATRIRIRWRSISATVSSTGVLPWICIN